ncbi:unnamed protein product [Danaus chrysippus]|uniref:(African queen) hypothetical protein n=1 Tax=Danaus chrysippus TaxID=151541 RepID=A0A8J2QFH2_9NEOP|nr:unnamed protein product [Danaus chrysippus]
MDRNNIIECGGFYFIHNFDSGNLGHVERVPTEFIAPTLNPKTNVSETPDYEFNLWTRPDCAGTEFENGNRTWFYFGIQASEPNVQVRLNLINLNKQGKMYNQGMAPVTRTLPGKPQWERIRDRPVHSTDDNTFTLSFRYRTSDNPKATTFFAFTYPFSFAELQIALNSIDLKMLPVPPPQSPDDIYYCRECLIYSLEGRRVDLLTISSHHGITTEREDRLKNLFPENQERPFKFQNKKVIFISARVHPGETPSSFVFNGFLNLLLTRNDPIAIQLRKLYVFKMIPFLNPDGVARGHYRTDTRGVNLNRVYLNPSLLYHPTVYASRSLIRYHHFGFEKEEDNCEDIKSFASRSIQNISESVELVETKKKKAPRSPNIKGDFKRDKAKTQASKPSALYSEDHSRDEFSGDAANLADQVLDMKLQEMPSQTDNISSNPSNANLDESSSLLNDNVLRSCLGSNVHLSTSEELNINGLNPLKPLRDTLKNSISLLMESSSSVVGESMTPELPVVKMGYCKVCRRDRDSMMSELPSYRNIEEYGEHQRQKIDTKEQKVDDLEVLEGSVNVFFCTNCFKRYIVTDGNEEIATATSSGDCVEGPPLSPRPQPPERPQPRSPAGSTGDSLPPVTIRKVDKPKSAPKSSKKRPPAVTAAPAPSPAAAPALRQHKDVESGLYLYIDLHGHASKKGIFMYGNHFEDLESSVECMLLPRIMSLNNLHFHFSSCNFTERNMYLKDRRDGMSREGSGRVAVLKATGLVRSYTLECNYNTGRLVNVLPPPCREPAVTTQPAPPPPKYTPHIFEEVGRSLGASILDLTGQHPNSRIPCSEHRNLAAVRDWLRTHSRTARPQLTMSRLRPKTSSPTRMPLFARSKAKVTDERKENAYVAAKSDTERRRSPPILAPRSGLDLTNNTKFGKKNEPAKSSSRTRYLADSEPKPKTLSTKRRNVLAIRKPNTSKTQMSGIVKAKTNRRAADDSDERATSAKLGKRGYVRPGRARRQPTSTSSSEAAGGSSSWEAGGSHETALAAKRRQYPNPAPSHLKKIRLKNGFSDDRIHYITRLGIFF